MAYRHRGFWQPADTVKERHALDAAYQAGDRPWMLWEQERDDDGVARAAQPPQRLRGEVAGLTTAAR
jgi:glucose-1-phosphate cytidylyltransferase